jgi:hypothetical protein
MSSEEASEVGGGVMETVTMRQDRHREACDELRRSVYSKYLAAPSREGIYMVARETDSETDRLAEGEFMAESSCVVERVRCRVERSNSTFESEVDGGVLEVKLELVLEKDGGRSCSRSTWRTRHLLTVPLSLSLLFAS